MVSKLIKEHGYKLNVGYHFLLYSALFLIAVLSAGHLNAPHENVVGQDNAGKDIVKERPLYQSCLLNGTESALTVKDTCIALAGSYGTGDDSDKWTPDSKDEAAYGQTVFQISVAAAVINAGLLFHALLMIFVANIGGVKEYLEYGTFLAWAVNLGLFGGVLGWLNGVENVAEEYNQKFNIVFGEDFNLYTGAVVALVLVAGLHTTLQLLLRCYFTKKRNYHCFTAPTETELSRI